VPLWLKTTFLVPACPCCGQASFSKYFQLFKHRVSSSVLLGKADKIVIDALIQALKDEDSDVRQKAADTLGILWKQKSEPELMELLKHPLSGYRTAAAYALAKKKSISPEIRDEIIRLKDTDNRPWVRLGAWKAYEMLEEKKEKEQKKASGE
jgi:HEAT repeat protein